MGFEFDARKSKRNLAKHGIDFIDAQKLWNDSNLSEVPARTEDEPRFIVIGMIGSKAGQLSLPIEARMFE